MNTDSEKIKELQDELEKIKKEKADDKKSFETRLAEVEKLLRTHGHEGPTNDGTKKLEREINLLPGESMGVGDVAAFSGASEVGASDRTLAIVGTGRDTNAKDGLNNSQIYIEHQYSTDGSTNQTFFQGIRSPIYVSSTGYIVSGASTLSQVDYTWVTDSLVGAYVAVNSADGTTFEEYIITANTENTLTISGSWSFSGAGLSFTIFIPIYLGSATFPWRRIYTGDLTTGGIRFGYGPTAGGQNGLLYMDAVNNGGLGFRNKAGSIFAIYSGTGAPSFSAAKGSLYVRTDGSSSSTRMYINTNGSTTWTNFTTAA